MKQKKEESKFTLAGNYYQSNMIMLAQSGQHSETQRVDKLWKENLTPQLLTLHQNLNKLW